MIGILRFFLLFIGLFLFSGVSALEAPESLKLDEATTTSLSVSWNPVEDATGYFIYYSTGSGEYNLQVDDIIESTGSVIENLEPFTSYYISVVSVDSHGGESDYSLELIASTLEDIGREPLSLQTIEVLSLNSVELSFNVSLEDYPDASRDFKIVNKDDSLDELYVVSSQLREGDNTKLILTFDRNAIVQAEYELTVIDLKSQDGKNVESGIDGISSFLMLDSFHPKEEIVGEFDLSAAPDDMGDDNSGIPVISDENNNIDEIDTTLNAAGVAVQDVNNALAGQNITEDEVITNTISESSKTEKLPQTGPEHLFLGILALFISMIFFFIRFRKV